jgi:hypothetical protein
MKEEKKLKEFNYKSITMFQKIEYEKNQLIKDWV